MNNMDTLLLKEIFFVMIIADVFLGLVLYFLIRKYQKQIKSSPDKLFSDLSISDLNVVCAFYSELISKEQDNHEKSKLVWTLTVAQQTMYRKIFSLQEKPSDGWLIEKKKK